MYFFKTQKKVKRKITKKNDTQATNRKILYIFTIFHQTKTDRI